MKYLKWLLMVLILVWVMALLHINYHNLNLTVEFTYIGLLTQPIDTLFMPLWVAVLIVFTAGFACAILLDVIAWYEYERMIRLQRAQIKGLQDKLESVRAKETPGQD